MKDPLKSNICWASECASTRHYNPGAAITVSINTLDMKTGTRSLVVTLARETYGRASIGTDDSIDVGLDSTNHILAIAVRESGKSKLTGFTKSNARAKVQVQVRKEWRIRPELILPNTPCELISTKGGMIVAQLPPSWKDAFVQPTEI